LTSSPPRTSKQLGRWSGERWTDEPFTLVRLVVGAIALLGTVLAVVLAVVSHDARMLEMVGVLWAVYGLTIGFLSGVLEPVIDGFFELVANAGLVRAGGGYSAIEALVVRGHYQAAADEYAERARGYPETRDPARRTIGSARERRGRARQPQVSPPRESR
jgi:hypothetical protein